MPDLFLHLVMLKQGVRCSFRCHCTSTCRFA